MNDPHLVLTTIHRLRASAVAPFFLSLRRTGFRGDVVVFASGIDRESIAQLKGWGARVMPFFFPGKHVSNRAARLWWIWKRIFASDISERAKERLAHIVFHLFYRRHLLYLDFLREASNRYSRILATDCRDVFFQADPFAWPQARGLHVFLEDDSNKIGKCSHHVRWLKSQFGEETLRNLQDQTVSCAGTVFGDAAALRDYYERIVSLAMRANSMREADGDQGLHNYLVLNAPHEQTTIHRNGEGPVATVGVMQFGDLQFNSAGLLVNKGGNVPPVIHQYDRIPGLRDALLARLRSPN